MSTPFYDLASLVVVPSGYKSGKVYAQKPQTTDGQLTFTRASSATRVASNGLIEKMRTNLLTYSNTFSNYPWGTSNATLTGGQSGYDGTTNGWKIEATATSCYISQGSYSVLRNHSIYAKAGTFNLVSIIVGGYSQGVTFNLTTGAVVTNTNSALYSPVITSVGSGWYRISVGIQTAAPTYGMLIAPNDINGGTISAGQFIYIQAAQTEYNDIATDYIPTTTAAVSVGPVSGLPRLDYLNSTCPKLLLEPQRTNLFNFSEQIDNAYWTKTNSTITANSVTSPDGYANADTVTASGSGSITHVITRNITTTSGSVYAFSVFVKKGNTDFIALRHDNGGTFNYFNINTGTKGATCDASATIENYGNGWYRCSVLHTATGSNGGEVYLATANGVVSFAAAGQFAYIYGAQYELGAYATSYIPTLAASVTRVADAASKTGISSLIGQTEGTIFIDFVWSNSFADVVPFDITGSDGKLIWMRDIGAQFYGNGTTLLADIGRTGAVQGTRYKIAFVYGQNDFRLYRNGSLIGTDTSGTFTGTFSSIALNSVINQANAFNQILLFTSKLTNAQLAELTAL